MNGIAVKRTLTATLSGPLVAAGIILGSMVIGDSATANAQPTTDGQWASVGDVPVAAADIDGEGKDALVVDGGRSA